MLEPGSPKLARLAPERRRRARTRNTGTDDVDLFGGHAEQLDQLTLRKVRQRRDRSRGGGDAASQQPSPQAFARAEPFWMSRKRDVMNRDYQRDAREQRRRVPGRKEHVQVIARHDRQQLLLFPSRPPASLDHVQRKAPGIERHRNALMRVEHEFVAASLLTDCPLM